MRRAIALSLLLVLALPLAGRAQQPPQPARQGPAPQAAPAAQGEAPRARMLSDDKVARHAGPSRAAGAVLWSHAGDAPRPTDPTPPPFVDVMRAAGHDVFRLERAPQGDTVAAGVAAVVASARDLRTRGYRRVVLAGQSAGGWISLAAVASAPGLAEAVIATAPAAYGSRTADPARAERNRDELLRILGSVRDTRVMLFFFDGDDFDPGGRGEAVAALLASRRVSHVLVDRPPSFRGHGVGLTSGFARRYGGCILAFVDISDPAQLACDAVPPAAVPWRFVGLPEVMPAAANDNSPLGRFVGAWQGSLDNGDDVMLVVEGGSSTRVSALFARGRSRLTKADQAFSQRRTGRLDDATGELVFEASQGLALRAAPPRGGALRLEVATADGKRQFSGVLKALSP